LAALDITSNLVEKIKASQGNDPELVNIMQKVEKGAIPDFSISEGILKFRNRLCVADHSNLRKELLQESHNSTLSAHPGSTKMYWDLKTHYWLPGMKRDVVEYAARCLTCQRVKAEHQKPGGLLQPLPIPVWKLEHISMDFVVGMPRTQKHHDAIWVVVDRLTKSAHFLPLRTTYSVEQLVELYIKEIVRLHGVPLSIVSDRDTKFAS